MIDRAVLRRAYRAEEQAVVRQRSTKPSEYRQQAKRAAIARSLVTRARASGGRLDAFLQAYDLDPTKAWHSWPGRGAARIPDARTADDLIHDKLSPRLGRENRRSRRPSSTPRHSRAADRKVLDEAMTRRRAARALGRALDASRAVIRTAVAQAMNPRRQLCSRTIDEALKRAAPDSPRWSHSFACSRGRQDPRDAARYARAYAMRSTRLRQSLRRFQGRAGISVKLSALHPRYE